MTRAFEVAKKHPATYHWRLRKQGGMRLVYTPEGTQTDFDKSLNDATKKAATKKAAGADGGGVKGPPGYIQTAGERVLDVTFSLLRALPGEIGPIHARCHFRRRDGERLCRFWQPDPRIRRLVPQPLP